MELPVADLYLVSCVKRRRASCSAARDLYSSPWFRKARACIEATGQPWAILSAKHGLVWPNDSIEPYCETLLHVRAEQRRHWADNVLLSLKPHLTNVSKVVIFAGVRYRERLAPELERIGINVMVPMTGLGIGRQLRWLNAALHESRAR